VPALPLPRPPQPRGPGPHPTEHDAAAAMIKTPRTTCLAQTTAHAVAARAARHSIIKPWLIRHLALFSPGSFATWPFFHLAHSPPGPFFTWLIRHLAFFLPGPFATWPSLPYQHGDPLPLPLPRQMLVGSVATTLPLTPCLAMAPAGLRHLGGRLRTGPAAAAALRAVHLDREHRRLARGARSKYWCKQA
jgi:hypothetical protein